MILNDNQIYDLADAGMITPFTTRSVSRMEIGNDMHARCMSYGVSSYGYDLRLSPKEFKIFRREPGVVVDPKNFSSNALESVKIRTDIHGSYFVLPALSYGLGVAVEKLDMPRDIVGICLGKSTYARCGIIANTTPAEPGWSGHLTLEFSNSSSSDCRMYANEGVVQVLFLQGKTCGTSYGDRGGKYQHQTENIVLPR